MKPGLRPLLLVLLGILTSPVTQAVEIIVDNTQTANVTITGAWTVASTSGTPYGGNYLHDASADKGAKSVRYTPSIPTAGLYEVFFRWTAGTNRPTNVPIHITTANGNAVRSVNQQLNGDQWMSLGIHSFNAGTSGSVLVGTTNTADGTYVIADAVRFVSAPTPIEVSVDNANTGNVTLTGTWIVGSLYNPYGGSYLHDNNEAKGSKSVRFRPQITATGLYEVFLRWTAASNRPSNVPVSIIGANGTASTTVDQRYNNNQWMSLGVHSFNAGTTGSVLVSNTDTADGTYVIADAVRFVPKAAWTPQDLGDQLWIDWWAEDLPAGSVSTWTSRNGGVSVKQSTSTARPVKQGNEVYFGSGKRMTMPMLGSVVDDAPYRDGRYEPQINHKGVAMVFRIADLQTASGDGTLFAVNGHAYSGAGNQQPSIKYNKEDNVINVVWRTPSSSNAIGFPVGTDPNQWHVLVSRRDQFNHYASLDGKKIDGTYGESVVAMADWAMMKNPVNEITGIIGDYLPTTIPQMAFDCILILQGDVTREIAEKITGWAMWRRGTQNLLPAAHPYKNAAPLSTGPQAPFIETTPTEWTDFTTWWTANSYANVRTGEGTTPNLTGWNLVFQDDFNTHSVTNDITGKGTWFAPTHPDPAGVAQMVRPALNTSNPALGTAGTPGTFYNENGTMRIRMQKVDGVWKSGTFASVNSNGHGRAWIYPYVEVRMKAGASTTGSRKGAWPAVWMKSLNYFTDRTETNMEYDIYEGYIVDVNDHHHFSLHNWPAMRVVPGRLASHRGISHTRQVGQSPWNTDLFDDQFHTYGAMVTPEWTYTYFDGKQIGRFPTSPEMQEPLFLLLTLDMKGDPEASQATGEFNLIIDYVKVYENPNYLPQE